MIIKDKLGSVSAYDISKKEIDHLCLEWFETSKRILHKRTENGRDVILRFLKESPDLRLNDVLYADEKILIVVDIIPCAVIVLRPATMYEMAWVGYEIGNKHLPLFYEEEELLIPHEAQLHKMLQASGFECRIENRKLLNPLRTTVSPHQHVSGGSLFSKILQLTSSNGKQ